MAESGCFKTWTQESWQGTVGSSWRKHAAAYTEATGKVEDQGVCAILSCTKSPLRLEWSNSVCLGSIVWNLLLEIGTYALSFKRLHTDQSFTNKAGRRKGGDSFYCIMPRYSKYMLRKWEARVPLPPQPEGPKPTSPTSHESAPTTRLEATLGGEASSTPALKVPHSAARNSRLVRAEGAARASGEGACASCRKLAEPAPGSAAPGCLLTARAAAVPAGLGADCGSAIQTPPLSLAPWLQERLSARGHCILVAEGTSQVAAGRGLLCPSPTCPKGSHTCFGAIVWSWSCQAQLPGPTKPYTSKVLVFSMPRRLWQAWGTKLQILAAVDTPRRMVLGTLGELRGKESGVSRVSRQLQG